MPRWLFWSLMAVALLFSLAACSAFSGPAAPKTPGWRHSHRAPAATRLEGNWWSDGTYRVQRQDPRSVQRFWRDLDTPFELQLVSELPGIPAETVASLNAKCRAQGTPEAYWLGWKLRRGDPWPVGIVCMRGRAMTGVEVAAACAKLHSRGHPMVVAWHRPGEQSYACREP